MIVHPVNVLNTAELYAYKNKMVNFILSIFYHTKNVKTERDEEDRGKNRNRCLAPERCIAPPAEP